MEGMEGEHVICMCREFRVSQPCIVLNCVEDSGVRRTRRRHKSNNFCILILVNGVGAQIAKRKKKKTYQVILVGYGVVTVSESFLLHLVEHFTLCVACDLVPLVVHDDRSHPTNTY